MIIQSAVLRVPGRCLTNQNLLAWIGEQNCHIHPTLVDRYCDKIDRLLRMVGADTRYVRDKDNGEKAFDLILDASRTAIKDSGFKISEIDLIIYASVSRGFLEPANAAFVAGALGIKCDAFDVSEACMGWVRAIHIAQHFLLSGTYSKILIINAEFNIFENGFPNTLRVMTDEQLARTFPALTIGEGVTATVVCTSTQPWKFRFRTAPEFVSLCNLPMAAYRDFSNPDDKIGANGPHQLVAFGMELSKVATREMIAFVRETYQDTEHIDAWLPHNAGEAGLKVMASELGLGGKLCSGVFQRYGNLVSASIPAAIVAAETDGRLKRGNRVVFCPASAGMAFGLIEGIF